MDNIEAEGDSIDQAIENALKLLGVERDAITVEVLSEGKKGIFGFGAQKAKVRATMRSATPAPAPTEAEPAGRTLTADEAAASAAKAKKVLEDILSLMGFSASVEGKTGERADEIVLEIRADNSGLIIGRKGQTLEALQYLVTRIASGGPASEAPHLIVDIENYHERRRKSLEDMALRLGEKAKRQRKTVTIDALSAADRRIIHSALQDDPWLTTKSLGQGSYRRLLIIPEGDRKKKEDANPGTGERPRPPSRQEPPGKRQSARL